MQKKKDSDAHTHAITNAHAHSMTYKTTELINFLTHLQKFISKTERICSCKCDEKLLNAEISEASRKYSSLTHPFVTLLASSLYLFHSVYLPGSYTNESPAAPRGRFKVKLSAD